MSFYGLGAVIGSYLGGWLSDTFGAWKVMFFSLLFSAPLFFSLLFLETFPEWCLGVVLLSTVGEAFRPALYASLGAYSRPENRTRSLSLVRLAINLGFSVGPALGGFIAYKYGFNALFWIDGFTCLFAAGIFGLLLRPKRSQAPIETPKPIRGQVMKDHTYLMFIFMTILITIVFMQLFSSVPLFFKQAYLLNESQIGLLMALNGIVVVLLEMPLIYSLEGRGWNTTWLIALGAAMIAACYGIFLIFPVWVGGAVLGILAISLGEIFNMPFANTLALNRAGDRSKGEYMAWYSMSFSVAFVVAPGVGLYIAANWGYNTLWTLMVIVGTIATLGYLKYSRDMERS